MALFQFPSYLITLQVPLLYLINILTLATGPNHRLLRVSISLPLVLLLAAQSLYREWDSGWGYNFALNCGVCSRVFTYVDWILLRGPDKEGWYKIQYGEKGKDDKNDNVKKLDYKDTPGGAGRTFGGRAWWALRLSTSNRYTGWSNQVKNVYMEVPANYPRLKFIARKTLRALVFFILKDILVSCSAASPHGTWIDIRTQKPPQPFAFDSPFLTRFYYTWLHILLTFVNMEFFNIAYGIVSVATGLANPRDCPSMFGRLSDLYSVRSAWSAVWHQQCRRLCSPLGVWMARDVLGLRKGSFASKYLQLFVGFGISGLVHGVASMLVNREFDDDGALKCFLLQAAIIMVEDHVVGLAKAMGFRDGVFWRLVGLLWMVGALGWSLEEWTGRNIARGVWVHNRELDLFGIGPKVIA